MDMIKELIGWKARKGTVAIDALQFRTWHSWAALAVALVVASLVAMLWH